MLSQRVIRASALRSGMAAARRLPIVQRRTFLPSEYTDRKTLDAKYPDPTRLSATQDPDMVSLIVSGCRIEWSRSYLLMVETNPHIATERRLYQPPSHQAPAS